MKRQIPPDAIVKLVLKRTSDGGRKQPLPKPPFRYDCPVYFGDERVTAYDCLFIVEGLGSAVEPGGPSTNVPVAFHSRELVSDKLKVGARITLWEGRDIGCAEILEVFVHVDVRPNSLPP